MFLKLVSLTVLSLILEDLMVPLNGSLIAADRIRQDLMDQAEDLRDIQEAIIDAQLDVLKANGVNKLNEEQLKNILVIS